MNIFIKQGIRDAIRRLIPVWENLGHRVTRDPNEGDVQLSIIRIVGKVKYPTVLRLDGVYYDRADDYTERNDIISKAHSRADGIVYQSALSKKMCEKYLSQRNTKIYDVIHNGIDSSKWNNLKEHNGINIVCCAKWRRPKRLPETIKIFEGFLKHHQDAKLHVLGQFLKGAKQIEHKNVIYYGKVGHKKMKKIYSVGDVYLHLCKKDSCPSTVLEAIAAGLPVVTTNACGGATEMCKLTKGCVIVNGEKESLEPDHIYKDEYNKIPHNVKEKIVTQMVGLIENKPQIILPQELTADYVGRKYINLMERVL